MDHAEFLAPGTVDEAADAIATAGRVAMVGSGHSFTDCSRAPGGLLLSSSYLNRIDEIDADQMTVTCGAGATVGELSRFLHNRGAALPNTASFPQLTIAGAMATGSHGTGPAFPGFAGFATELEIVDAAGGVHRARRGDKLFQAAGVGLGALGMITEVTLEILPEFDVHQRVYGGISVDHFIEHAAQDMCRADNVGALIDFGAGEVALLYVRDRVEVGEPMPPPSRHDFGGELVEGDVQAWESHMPMATT